MTSLEQAGLATLYDVEGEELVVYECVSVNLGLSTPRARK
jgi:hypothetical protein